MLDNEMLDLIVCPENRTPLKRVDSAFLDKANAAIEKGSVKNRGNGVVDKPLEDGLIREDGAVFYPVIDGIPVLLVDEGIETSQFE